MLSFSEILTFYFRSQFLTTIGHTDCVRCALFLGLKLTIRTSASWQQISYLRSECYFLMILLLSSGLAKYIRERKSINRRRVKYARRYGASLLIVRWLYVININLQLFECTAANLNSLIAWVNPSWNTFNIMILSFCW